MNPNKQFSCLTLKTIRYFFVLVFFCGVVGCTSPRPPQFTPDMMQMMQSAGDRSLHKMGAEPISDVPPELLRRSRDFQVNVFILQSVAGEVTDKFDIFGTIIQEVGPLPLQMLGWPPDRKVDSDFALKAKTLLASWESSPHEYTLNKLQERLSTSPGMKVNYYAWGNWDEIPALSHDTQPPVADVNMSLTINLFIQDVTGTWDLSESSLQMWGMMSGGFADKEVMQRLQSQSHTRRPNLKGFYFINAYITTDVYPKSKWLSEDGHFLQQQITLLIDELIADACQELNRKFE